MAIPIIYKTTKETQPYLYWAPRIMVGLVALFITILAVGNITTQFTFWQTVTSLFQRHISLLILLAVLLGSLKSELISGVSFIMCGLFYISYVVKMAPDPTIGLAMCALVTGTASLIGILFLINWYINHKSKWAAIRADKRITLYDMKNQMMVS